MLIIQGLKLENQVNRRLHSKTVWNIQETSRPWQPSPQTIPPSSQQALEDPVAAPCSE